MNNYAFGMPAGPVPLFKAPDRTLPGNRSVSFARAMLEATNNQSFISSKTRVDTNQISLQQIADLLFDSDSTLARRLVDSWELPLDADSKMSRDAFDIALVGNGIPLDIQKDYENSSTMSIQRIADEYFAGKIDDARNWALTNKVYPLPSGRYIRPAVEDELTAKVFTESARKFYRVHR